MAKAKLFKNLFNGTTTVGKLLAMVTVICVISQAPIMQSIAIPRYVAYGTWIILLGYLLLFERPKNLYLPMSFLLVTVLYILYIVLGTLISDQYNYTYSHCWYSYLVCVFILITSVMCGRFVNEQDFKLIIKTYFITSLIFSVNVFLSYLTEVDFSSRFFEYSQKNAAGMIVFIGLMFGIIFLFKETKGITKIGLLIALAFMTYTILCLRSRGSIICIPISLIIILIFGKSNKKARIAVIIFLAVAFLLLLNEEIYDTFVNGILFSNRNTEDLNDLTSGRASEWEQFPELIKINPLFGIASYKIESFPLMTLVELGLIMGSIIVMYAASPVYFALRRCSFKEPYTLCFLVIGILFCVNGFFEALTPLGPGVKCMMYWMFYGIFYGMQSRTDDFAKLCILRKPRGLKNPHDI